MCSERHASHLWQKKEAGKVAATSRQRRSHNPRHRGGVFRGQTCGEISMGTREIGWAQVTDNVPTKGGGTAALTKRPTYTQHQTSKWQRGGTRRRHSTKSGVHQQLCTKTHPGRFQHPPTTAPSQRKRSKQKAETRSSKTTRPNITDKKMKKKESALKSNIKKQGYKQGYIFRRSPETMRCERFVI